MKEKTIYVDCDQHIAELQEKVDKLEIRARTALFKKQRAEIRAEIERTKRLIRHLRKTEKGNIQHADMGSSITEEIDDG